MNKNISSDENTISTPILEIMELIKALEPWQQEVAKDIILLSETLKMSVEDVCISIDKGNIIYLGNNHTTVKESLLNEIFFNGPSDLEQLPENYFTLFKDAVENFIITVSLDKLDRFLDPYFKNFHILKTTCGDKNFYYLQIS